MVIQWQSTDLSTSTGDRREPCRASAGPPAMAAGQSPGKLAVCSLVRPITVRVPDGDRQATADPVLTAVQGHENRPAICRCRKIGIRQKSAKNLVVTAGFIILVTSPLEGIFIVLLHSEDCEPRDVKTLQLELEPTFVLLLKSLL